jgi:regulator of replication initiation timing
LVKPDKSRYVYLYLPSEADKQRWEKLAAKARTPLSKFCIEIIESTLAENEQFKPRREMVQEMETLKAENKALRDDLRQKSIVLERYEGELKRYRSHEEGYQGMRRYSKELVEILKTRGQVDSYRLLEALGIDPRESELVKAVSKQLEELEEYGMVKAEPRGWRWIG